MLRLDAAAAQGGEAAGLGTATDRRASGVEVIPGLRQPGAVRVEGSIARAWPIRARRLDCMR
jgi:hypothetical protein